MSAVRSLSLASNPESSGEARVAERTGAFLAADGGLDLDEVCALADYLLLLLLTGDASCVRIEPQGVGGLHRVNLVAGHGLMGAFGVDAEFGRLLVLRLGLLADLDVARASSQAGTAWVSFDEVRDEVLVALRPAQQGLACELRILDGLGTTPAVDELSLKPGAQIGPYVVTATIGRGGMGVVYAAEHAILRRRVAIKVLIGEVLRSDPGSARRFVREAQAAARIQHPGIVDVIDFGTLPDGQPYLVMERLMGRTLAEVCDQEGALEPQRALALAIGMADALAAAHAAGVLHRDLTPRNVFVLEEDSVERVVLLDFGSATTSDPEHAAVPDGPPGMVIGTPRYMAPEVVRGAEVDQRTDIYALGAILYELVSGRPPFTGPSPTAIIRSQLDEAVPPLDVCGGLPEALERLVYRALAKDPADRFESVTAMLDEMVRIARDLVRAKSRIFIPL